MSYRLSGRIEALLGPDCREVPVGGTLRLFTAQANETPAFAVLSKRQAAAREVRWLADAEIASDGRFTVDLPADDSYSGGPLEVGLRATGPKRGRKRPRTIDCTLLALTPDWQPGGSDRVQACDWQYALPAPAWAQVREHLGAYVIVGRLSARDGIAPLTGVRVAAFDVDLVQDDSLGHGITDIDGWFRIDYPADAMRRTPLPDVSHENGSADVYFTADHRGRHLLSEPRTAGRSRDRRNVGPAFCVRLRSDAAPLTLTIDTPAPGKVTNQPQLTITGSASEACHLTLNDEPVALDSHHHFTTQVTLTEGTNLLTLAGTTTATGAQARQTLTVLLDSTAPAPPDLALVTAGLGDTDLARVTGAATAVEAAAVVEATNIRTGDQAETQADADGAFALTLPATAGDTVTLTARDTAGNTSTSVQLSLAGTLPPDPADVAPPLSTTTITPLAEATAFLYTGDDPIQAGADPDVFVPHRAAVLRGRVITVAGNPLPGTTITVHGHPEYGQTLSRADGWFDLAANGGGLVTLTYTKDGYLTAHRTAQSSWQAHSVLPDVALLAADPAVTRLEFTDTAAARMARATTITDHDGTRRANLFVPAATTATMHMPDGTSQPLTTAHVRITEYTVGDQGAPAMPADLPPSSAYTYALECNADEAVQSGASEVRFSQPVILYLENFLDFPPGLAVPLGSFDRTATHWTAEPDGRVITLVSITAGQANLDVTGDGQPDSTADLAAFGISEDERTHLAATYPPGQQLWRAALRHFTTPWDCNWPYKCPDDATDPDQPLARNDSHTPDPRKCPGSIIDMDNQVLGERLPLAGTGLSLHYNSDRTPGFTPARTLRIPLTGAKPPASLKRIELEVEIEGRRLLSSHNPTANLIHTLTWDGLDAADRPVQGARPARITISYIYPAVYVEPARFASSFAMTASSGNRGGGGSVGGIGGGLLPNRTRSEIIWRQTYRTTIGSWNTPTHAGFGGWAFTNHHTYDPTTHTLHMGDGNQHSATAFGSIITTIAGTSQLGFGGDNGPARQAQFGPVWDLTVAPDGSVYFCDTANDRVRRIDPDGIITTVAGGGGFPAPPGEGDGGPATAALLSQPVGIAISPDNTLYILSNRRIRKVDPDGIITTLANLARQDQQPLWGLTLGPDGSLYTSELGRFIYRIAPDGTQSILAGGGTTFSDNVPATQTLLDPHGLHCSPDGSIYVASQRQARVRKISPDGIITTVAGTGDAGHAGDGGPATNAKLAGPYAITLGPDGTLYITDTTRIRAVTPDGIITTIAGTGQLGDDGDGEPAVNAQQYNPYCLATNPNGALYIGYPWSYRIRKIDSPFPGLTSGEYSLPSPDGRQLHVFDARRLHARTLNAYTGATLTAFHYDDQERLVTITHGDPAENNTVTITRDDYGQPTAITGPDGHRTQLSLNPDGYLAQITDPANATTTLRYHPGGLLAALTNPLGHQHTYTYEPDGRLHSDTNPAGTTTLAGKRTTTSHTVTALTTEGRESTYAEEHLPSGATRRTTQCCGEHGTVTFKSPDGSGEIAAPDATIYREKTRSDVRWGAQVPRTSERTITTPAGARRTTSTEHAADLADASDPLSMTRLTQRTTADGRAYATTYDSATRSWTYAPPNGPSTAVTTDNVGRMIRAQLGSLAVVSVTYDDRGRLTTLTRGTGSAARIWTCRYSGKGDLAKITNPLGQTTTFAHDAVGRPITITAPDNSSLHIGYDAVGNVTALTPAGLSPHSFEYDEVGNLAAYRPPSAPGGAGSTLYTYDADRLLTRITRSGNTSTALYYDAAGRLERVSNDIQETNWTYIDGTRRLATMTTSGGSIVTRTFDGPLLVSETWHGPVDGTVRFTYDNTFLRASQEIGTESPISLARDASGRLINVGDLRIDIDSSTGLRTGKHLGAVTETWRHNSFGEPVEHRVKYSKTEIYAVTYDRDELGRITGKEEVIDGKSEHTIYEYDERGRLVSVAIDGSTSSYTYDDNGNRTTSIINSATLATAHNAQDQLLTFGGQTLIYGTDGELEQKIDPQQGATDFQYDGLGNLCAIGLPNGSEIEYLLDAADRPVVRMVDGSRSAAYLYDDSRRLIAELGADGKVTTEFVFDTSGTTPAYFRKSGKVFRVIADHAGSPRLVVDVETGDLIQRIDYDAWGSVTRDTRPGFQPFGFAGGHYDSATGLVRYDIRYYDPALGRWITKDRLGIVGETVNRYSYCENDPVNRIDPNGALDKAIGVEVDFSAIAPWFSGGGGKVGLNIQWVIGKWVDLYWVVPTNKPSSGFSIGISCEVNFASGQGDWKGLFESRGGNTGPFSGSEFHGYYNPQSYEVPWAGISHGWSWGPSLGFYKTETDYIPWVGNR
ncbi:NHL domain-containing protein [Streptomyces chartreusis]